MKRAASRTRKSRTVVLLVAASAAAALAGAHCSSTAPLPPPTPVDAEPPPLADALAGTDDTRVLVDAAALGDGAPADAGSGDEVKVELDGGDLAEVGSVL